MNDVADERLDALRDSIVAHLEQLELRLRTDMEQLELRVRADIRALSDRIESLERRMDLLEHQVVALKTEMVERFETVAERFRALDVRITLHENRVNDKLEWMAAELEQLKGKVEIFSVEGRGSRFVIHVPLTLAILDGILVRVGQERYIVPTVFIKEALRPRPEDISSVRHKADMIKIRNNLLPLIRLHQTLGVTPEKKEPWESLVIVVENEGQQKCLMVDDMIGKQEVVIKNMGEKLKDVQGVAGATIMGDGRVGLILDIHGIFQMDMRQ